MNNISDLAPVPQGLLTRAFFKIGERHHRLPDLRQQVCESLEAGAARVLERDGL